MLDKKLTEEQKRKISYLIEIEGNLYPSIIEAEKYFSVCAQTISNRCKSDKWPNWKIISKGQKYNVLYYRKF